jgi:hypothetical protein
MQNSEKEDQDAVLDQADVHDRTMPPSRRPVGKRSLSEAPQCLLAPADAVVQRCRWALIRGKGNARITQAFDDTVAHFSVG